MNTSKQINAMIGLLFVIFVILSAYLLNENNRLETEGEEITERNAERGARLFVQNCRTCHGLEGLGPGEGAIAAAVNSDAFLVLGEDNEFGADETPEAEAEGIRSYLRETIECGRPGTFMPTWAIRFGGTLSDTQVEHLVTLITNDPTGKTDFWDLVREEAEHADEEQFGAVLEVELGTHPTAAQIRERSEQVTVVTDPSELTVNTEACGTFTSDTKTKFRNRNPLVAGTPEPTATPDDGEATATPPPSGGPALAVELTEWAVATEASVDANGVTFNVNNAGAVAHELAVIRTDLPADGLPVAGGLVDESGLDVVGRVPEFAGGSSQSITLDLTPGNYVLICNIPAHYGLGMTTSLTVE
jgi:mono/diheme cytochrome c family protein